MNKKEEYDEPMPEGAPKEDKKVPEMTPESRLDDMEKSIKSITKGMDQILKHLQKADDEEEDKDKKKEEEEEEEEDKEKKKDIGTEEQNPNPEGGDTKLPQAPAGETDETVSPAGDKGNSMVAKVDINKAVEKKVTEILKGMNLTKSQTPRSRHENDPIAENAQAKTEFALDMLKRAKAGKITAADMNRETKDFVKSRYESNIRKVINQEVQ